MKLGKINDDMVQFSGGKGASDARYYCSVYYEEGYGHHEHHESFKADVLENFLRQELGRRRISRIEIISYSSKKTATIEGSQLKSYKENSETFSLSSLQFVAKQKEQ